MILALTIIDRHIGSYDNQSPEENPRLHSQPLRGKVFKKNKLISLTSTDKRLRSYVLV